jgi:hypothetical protein
MQRSCRLHQIALCWYVGVAIASTAIGARTAFGPLRLADVSDGKAAAVQIIRRLLERSSQIDLEGVISDSGDVSLQSTDSPFPEELRDVAGWHYVKTLLRLLHVQQNPPTEECRRTRLLLVRSPAISYEGLGSTLLTLSLGLAEVRTPVSCVARRLRPLSSTCTGDVCRPSTRTGR